MAPAAAPGLIARIDHPRPQRHRGHFAKLDPPMARRQQLAGPTPEPGRCAAVRGFPRYQGPTGGRSSRLRPVPVLLPAFAGAVSLRFDNVACCSAVRCECHQHGGVPAQAGEFCLWRSEWRFSRRRRRLRLASLVPLSRRVGGSIAVFCFGHEAGRRSTLTGSPGCPDCHKPLRCVHFGQEVLAMLRELDSEDPTTTTIRLVSPQVADCVQWMTLWGFANPDASPSSLRSSQHRDEHEFSAVEARSAVGDRYQRPDPEALLLNVLRIHAGRQALVDQGTYTVREIARARDRHRNTVHKEVQRACERGALFTVAVNGEKHVPAVLLDEALEVREDWVPVVSTLREAGMSGWGIWRWIAEANAGLSGEIAADVIETNPDRVYAAAERRVAQLAE